VAASQNRCRRLGNFDFLSLSERLRKVNLQILGGRGVRVVTAQPQAHQRLKPLARSAPPTNCASGLEIHTSFIASIPSIGVLSRLRSVRRSWRTITIQSTAGIPGDDRCRLQNVFRVCIGYVTVVLVLLAKKPAKSRKKDISRCQFRQRTSYRCSFEHDY